MADPYADVHAAFSPGGADAAPAADTSSNPNWAADMARANAMAAAYNSGDIAAYRDLGGTAVDTRTTPGYVAPSAPIAPQPVVNTPPVQQKPVYKITATGEIIAGADVWGGKPPAGVTLVGYGEPPRQMPDGTVKPAVITTMNLPGQPGVASPVTNPATVAAQPQQILKDFLESDPKLMLGLSMNEFRKRGASPVFMNWFSRNFDSFWTQYLGQLAQQAQAGQVPNGSFVGFVESLDPTGQFFGAGPAAGGYGGANRFAQFAASKTS